MTFFTHKPETRVQRELLERHLNNLAHMRRRIRETTTLKERSKDVHAPDVAVLSKQPTYLLRHTRSAPGSTIGRRSDAGAGESLDDGTGSWLGNWNGQWSTVWHNTDDDHDAVAADADLYYHTDDDDGHSVSAACPPPPADVADYYDQFQLKVVDEVQARLITDEAELHATIRKHLERYRPWLEPRRLERCVRELEALFHLEHRRNARSTAAAVDHRPVTTAAPLTAAGSSRPSRGGPGGLARRDLPP